ncbi:MAG: N-acetylmuramoyl-L-alanine amidase [Ruminococcaceae bacterium]|nr:N-acetylmuramoyl-L-alanine amidase [Oscillospiraceae bacterium]
MIPTMYSAGDFLLRKRNNVIEPLLLSLKFFLFSIILILIAMILWELMNRDGTENEIRVHSTFSAEETVIVIDAGHGGEDGGAVGINSCIEKDINLKIALSLYELLKMSDIPAVLTRDSDIMLSDNAAVGHKKLQDLKNRLEISESLDNSLLVSIHMNSYPVEKYSGAQVYYSKGNEKSKQAAEMIRESFEELISKDNTRLSKEASSAIYLLHNATKPSVLVECGFISNRAEAELLCSENYQNKVSLTLYTAILKYISSQRI